ncbi:MAG: UDP-glucose 4-epimerase GalE [Planctomycetota bacterium]
MAVMITGGAGYIGSHAVQRMLRDGHEVVAFDSLGRGHREPMDLLKQQDYGKKLTFVEGDIADRETVAGLIRDHGVDTVMHFAALAYVGESVTEPLRYYRNNTAGTLSLLEAVEETGVSRFVFSSTCATYGEPTPPIREDAAQSPINPYGVSKLHVEHMLRDFGHKQRLAGNPFGWAALRYFNVAGSDRTCLIGEDHDPETHLIPVILNTVLGKRESISIFGTDYPTPDGTCIRDYVHVEDLVDAHVHVMDAIEHGDERFYNLGIGRGYSVREIIDAVKRVTGVDFKVTETARRSGDPPELYADPAKIQSELGWKASITDVDEVIATAWAWFEKNPRGYAGGQNG